MNEASSFVTEIFGKKSLYEILGVEKTAPEDEIRRAYRKLALVHHPDRTGGDAEKFKALSIVHTILSDSEKRSLYDSTGDIDNEDTDDNFKDWYDYFRNLFPALTTTKIDQFQAEYIGSEEERHDLIEAYQKFNGNMDKVMDYVIFAEEGEEERLCSTIDSIIAFGDLTSTPKFESFKEKVRKAALKPKKNKRKSAKGADSSESDLAALILSNRSSRGNGLASVMAKYGGDINADADDVSEEAFQQARNRVEEKTKSKKSRK